MTSIFSKKQMFKHQLTSMHICIKGKNSQNDHFHKSKGCLVELDCNGYQQLCYPFYGSKLHHRSCGWTACRPYKCHRSSHIFFKQFSSTNVNMSTDQWLVGYNFYSITKKIHNYKGAYASLQIFKSMNKLKYHCLQVSSALKSFKLLMHSRR